MEVLEFESKITKDLSGVSSLTQPKYCTTSLWEDQQNPAHVGMDINLHLQDTCQKPSSFVHGGHHIWQTGNGRYKILNKEVLASIQAPLAETHLLNQLYFTSSWSDCVKFPHHKRLWYNKKQADRPVIIFYLIHSLHATNTAWKN